MTELVGIELRRLDLTLTETVGTATGPHRRRPLLLARVVTDEGEGWGECGALEGRIGLDPSVDDVTESAVSKAGELLARGEDSPAVLSARTDVDASARMAHALFEMALLDAGLSGAGRSLGEHLGADRSAAPVGAMVGIPSNRDVGALLDAVAAVLDPASGGARRLRLKIAPGWDLVPVQAVRATYPDLPLQVDANGSYSATSLGDDGVDRLRGLEPYGLTCVEQPLPAPDLEAHARLASELPIPIALDESLWSLERVDDALRVGAMSVACLKPARLGGLEQAVAAQSRCADAGCRTFVGGLFESGLGRSANLSLAGRSGFDVPSDLTSPVGYLSAQPFGYPQVRDGMVSLPTGPGVGVVADHDVIEHQTLWTRWFDGRGT